MRYRIKGNYIEQSTGEVRVFDAVINADSVDAAKKWAKASYNQATVIKVKEVE